MSTTTTNSSNDVYTAGQLTKLISPANAEGDATLVALFATPAAAAGQSEHLLLPTAGRNKKQLNSVKAKKKMATRGADIEVDDGDADKVEAQQRKKIRKTKRQEVMDHDAGDAGDEETAAPIDRAAVKARTKLAKQRQAARASDPRNCRTVFVGNVAATTKKRQLLALFRRHGPIESARFRSAAPADASVIKRLAVIHKKLSRPTLNAYIVYKDQASVAKATSELNGHCLCGHHLRVDSLRGSGGEGQQPGEGSAPQRDNSKCVFLGNLSFKADEESVRAVFSQCGRLTNIRLIRDSRSGLGKGFGYVQFGDAASVELALKLTGSELNGRCVRVTRCSDAGKTGRTGTKQKVATSGTKVDKQQKRITKVQSDKSVSNKKPTGSAARSAAAAARPTNRNFSQAFQRMMDKRRCKLSAKKINKGKQQNQQQQSHR